MIRGGSVISPILPIINSYLQRFTAHKWKYPAMLSVKWCQMAIHLPMSESEPLNGSNTMVVFTPKTGGFVNGYGSTSKADTVFVCRRHHHLVFTKYMTWFLDCWLGWLFFLSQIPFNLVLLHNHFPSSYVEKEHCMVPNIWFLNPLRSHGFWRELIWMEGKSNC